MGFYGNSEFGDIRLQKIEDQGIIIPEEFENKKDNIKNGWISNFKENETFAPKTFAENVYFLDDEKEKNLIEKFYGNGFHAGIDSKTYTGVAIGKNAYSYKGGSLGQDAYTQGGGAIGEKTCAVGGFAGGYCAKAIYFTKETAQIANEKIMFPPPPFGSVIGITFKLEEPEDKYIRIKEISFGEQIMTLASYPVFNDDNSITCFIWHENKNLTTDMVVTYYAGSLEETLLTGVGSATGTFALTVTGGAVGYNSLSTNGFAGGCEANASGNGSVAIGNESNALKSGSVAIGNESNALAENSIQLGTGTNNNEGSLQFKDYTIMTSDGAYVVSTNWYGDELPTDNNFKEGQLFFKI